MKIFEGVTTSVGSGYEFFREAIGVRTNYGARRDELAGDDIYVDTRITELGKKAQELSELKLLEEWAAAFQEAQLLGQSALAAASEAPARELETVGRG